MLEAAAEPTEFPTSVINKTMAVTVATPSMNVSHTISPDSSTLTNEQSTTRKLTDMRDLGLSGDLDSDGGEPTTHPLQDLVDDQLGGRSSSSSRVEHHPHPSQTDDQPTE
jgi:hypothetical protein